MTQQCFFLTVDELSAFLAAGYTLVSGGYDNEKECQLNCGQFVEGSSSSSLSSSSGSQGGVSCSICPGVLIPFSLTCNILAGAIDVSVTLTFDGVNAWKTCQTVGTCACGGIGRFGGNVLFTVSLTCDAQVGAWRLNIANNVSNYFPVQPIQCNPLSMTFNNVDLTGCNGGVGTVGIVAG